MSIMLCNTNDIYVACIDLTSEDKLALLRQTELGARAIPQVIAMRDRLAVAVQSGKPFTAELAAADKQHDIACAALDLSCRLHDLLSALPQFAHLGARADRVRSTLTVGGGLTTASYVDTAATAARNRTALPGCADALAAMPVAEGVTAADVAEIFIGGGEDVGRWMAKRDDARAAASIARNEASGRILLNEARELLIRLRGTLDHEVSWRDDLPNDLSARIFSVLDGRIAAAVASARGAREVGAGQDAVAALDAAEAADAAQAEQADRAAPPAEPSAAAPFAADAPSAGVPDGRADDLTADTRGGSGPRPADA